MKTTLLTPFLVLAVSIPAFALTRLEPLPSELVEQLADSIVLYHQNDERIAKRCSAYDHRPLIAEKSKFTRLNKFMEKLTAIAPYFCTASDLNSLIFGLRLNLEVQACLDRLNLCGFNGQEYDMCADSQKQEAMNAAVNAISESCKNETSKLERDEL